NALRLALPLQSRLDGAAGATTDPHVDPCDREQERQREPRPPPHPEERAARQHDEDRIEHSEMAARLEEQLEERRLLALVNEREERPDAAPHRALVRA